MDATLIGRWEAGERTYVAARVTEAHGLTEYVASVPTVELAGKTAVQERAILRSALKAVRDADSLITPRLQPAAISGTITI